MHYYSSETVLLDRIGPNNQELFRVAITKKSGDLWVPCQYQSSNLVETYFNINIRRVI